MVDWSVEEINRGRTIEGKRERERERERERGRTEKKEREENRRW